MGEKTLGKELLDVASSANADKILYVTHKERDKGEITQDRLLGTRVSIVNVKNPKEATKSFSVRIKKFPQGSLKAVKEFVSEGISRDMISQGDKLLCIIHESVGIGYKGIQFLFDVDATLFNISRHQLSQHIHPSVIKAILDISSEIALEGREGKKVGTGFVIGDGLELQRHVKQMVLNPFLGYQKEKLKITDPDIKETIKEFAQLDGAFILGRDGSIVTACAYIDVPTDDFKMQGFGTRHRSLAAITSKTASLSVVVSQSGSISLFKEGQMIMKL